MFHFNACCFNENQNEKFTMIIIGVNSPILLYINTINYKPKIILKYWVSKMSRGESRGKAK